MTPLDTVPITVTITQLCKLSGFGRTKIKNMIRSGELESIRHCGKRYIIFDSYLRAVGLKAVSGRIRALQSAAE